MKTLSTELYWQLQGCGRVRESRYGISFWQHQNCYLPKSWGGVDLVIPLYQVHTYLYGPHIMYTNACRYEMHFSLNYVKMSFSILSFKYVGTCFLVLKTDCIINNNVFFYSYRVMYSSPSPLSNFLPHYPMHMLKLLPKKYISSMGSCQPVDSYKSLVSAKHNTKIQVHKNK